MHIVTGRLWKEAVRKCDPGYSIMADNGFNIQDLFAPANVTISIPSFFKKTK